MASSVKLIRWSGIAAMLGGVQWVWIPIVYTIYPLGAAGDKSFGDFDKLRFSGPVFFTVGLVGLHVRYAGDVGRSGRWGLVLATVGSALIAVGMFGGDWLDFPRSGNYLTFPGSLLVRVGLIAFGIAAIRARVSPSWSRILPLAIGVLPLILVFLLLLVRDGLGLRHSETAILVIAFVSLGSLWTMLGYALWSFQRLNRE